MRGWTSQLASQYQEFVVIISFATTNVLDSSCSSLFCQLPFSFSNSYAKVLCPSAVSFSCQLLRVTQPPMTRVWLGRDHLIYIYIQLTSCIQPQPLRFARFVGKGQVQSGGWAGWPLYSQFISHYTQCSWYMLILAYDDDLFLYPNKVIYPLCVMASLHTHTHRSILRNIACCCMHAPFVALVTFFCLLFSIFLLMSNAASS